MITTLTNRRVLMWVMILWTIISPYPPIMSPQDSSFSDSFGLSSSSPFRYALPVHALTVLRPLHWSTKSSLVSTMDRISSTPSPSLTYSSRGRCELFSTTVKRKASSMRSPTNSQEVYSEGRYFPLSSSLSLQLHPSDDGPNNVKKNDRKDPRGTTGWRFRADNAPNRWFRRNMVTPPTSESSSPSSPPTSTNSSSNDKSPYTELVELMALFLTVRLMRAYLLGARTMMEVASDSSSFTPMLGVQITKNQLQQEQEEKLGDRSSDTEGTDQGWIAEQKETSLQALYEMNRQSLQRPPSSNDTTTAPEEETGSDQDLLESLRDNLNDRSSTLTSGGDDDDEGDDEDDSAAASNAEMFVPMHEKEGDRVIATMDEFPSSDADSDQNVILDEESIEIMSAMVADVTELSKVAAIATTPTVVSTEFGRPLEVVEANIPPLADEGLLSILQEEGEDNSVVETSDPLSMTMTENQQGEESDVAVDTAADLDATADLNLDTPADLIVETPIDLNAETLTDLSIETPSDLNVEPPDLYVEPTADLNVKTPTELDDETSAELKVEGPTELKLETTEDPSVETSTDLDVLALADLTEAQPTELYFEPPASEAAASSASGTIAAIEPEDESRALESEVPGDLPQATTEFWGPSVADESEQEMMTSDAPIPTIGEVTDSITATPSDELNGSQPATTMASPSEQEGESNSRSPTTQVGATWNDDDTRLPSDPLQSGSSTSLPPTGLVDGSNSEGLDQTRPKGMDSMGWPSRPVKRAGGEPTIDSSTPASTDEVRLKVDAKFNRTVRSALDSCEMLLSQEPNTPLSATRADPDQDMTIFSEEGQSPTDSTSSESSSLPAEAVMVQPSEETWQVLEALSAQGSDVGSDVSPTDAGPVDREAPAAAWPEAGPSKWGLGERTFRMLQKLGLVEATPDPNDPNYDHSHDDEISSANKWRK